MREDLIALYLGYNPDRVFTEYVPELDFHGKNLGWESKPDLSRILAIEQLSPVIGMPISLQFYHSEISRYNICRQGIAKIWLKDALNDCPVAAEFLKLEPLEATIGPKHYETGQRMGFLIPFLRIRRPMTKKSLAAVGNMSPPHASRSDGDVETGSVSERSEVGIFGLPRVVPGAQFPTDCLSASRSETFSRFGLTHMTQATVVRMCTRLDRSMTKRSDPDAVSRVLQGLNEDSWLMLDARIAGDLIQGYRLGFTDWQPSQFSPEEYCAWVKL